MELSGNVTEMKSGHPPHLSIETRYFIGEWQTVMTDICIHTCDRILSELL
jgi:hypothetical protein